ncbi:EamA family transporter [Actinokineospora enzanensis]|uniref:EamA family transporter n=1 Tax=Actinokineospora enzanensis TaxID=155975 RepID=UPI00035FD37A|nr:EamA family transporter [Actinokineospora enzanensis]
MSASDIETTIDATPDPSARATVPPTGRPGVSRKTLWLVASFAMVCLIWGSTWIAIKIAVTDLPPMTASGLRFVVAAPVFIIACRSMRKPLAYPRGLGWFFVFIFACYFAIPFFLYNYGEQYISSGLTAICFSSVAVMMVVFSVPILRTRITPTQFLAVLVAFTALGLLIVHSQGVGVGSGWGVAAVLSAAVMHALSYIMIKKYGGGMHSLTLNTMPMAVAGVLLTGLGLLVERPGAEAFTAASVGATLYLGVVASVIGFAVYFWLVQRIDTVTVSFVFVLFPIVAQILGVFLEDTAFDLLDTLLTVVILGSFAITQWGQRRTRRLTAEASAPAALDADGLPTEAALAAIYEHARRAYPAEACGFVRAGDVRECVNTIDELSHSRPEDFTRTSRTGYAFGVADLRELADSFDGDDPVRVVYHSHPDVGAYFSDEDHRNAVFEGAAVYPVRHLVVDATADGARGARLFDFSETEGRYVESAVFGEPRDRVPRPETTGERA